MMTARNIVAFVHVQNVPHSIAFYEKLGFRVHNTFTPPGQSEPVWVWLDCDRGSLMLGRADGPVDAGQQAVLFYVYVEDVAAKREELIAAGITATPVHFPFYSPRGEFRIVDPDGYVIMVSHAD
jgi:predicted enzyme related to lactoylglutathione lyase